MSDAMRGAETGAMTNAGEPAGPGVHVRSFVARNQATQSENRIHSDDVARQYGFRGGLVPGVTSYAYIADTVFDVLGVDWLRSGRLSVRCALPVYDGDGVRVVFDPSTGAATLADSGGVGCVEGRAGADPVVTDPASAVLGIGATDGPATPHDRPPADERSLAEGTVLGTLRYHFSLERQAENLAEINIDPARFTAAGLAHPGYLIRDANSALALNVALGPWIHVGSDTSLLGNISDGADVEVRSRVRSRYERKGHAFVELDVVTLADGVVASHVHHTSIYRPRVVR